MRPLYETEADLAREAELAARVERKWDCKLHKLSIKYRLDFAMKRSDRVIAFCEIKSRHGYSWERLDALGGYLLSIDKWVAATHLCPVAGVPFILTVDASGDVRYQIYREFTPKQVLIRGRTDRGDWQDIEPCVILDCKLFKGL